MKDPDPGLVAACATVYAAAYSTPEDSRERHRPNQLRAQRLAREAASDFLAWHTGAEE